MICRKPQSRHGLMRIKNESGPMGCGLKPALRTWKPLRGWHDLNPINPRCPVAPSPGCGLMVFANIIRYRQV